MMRLKSSRKWSLFFIGFLLSIGWMTSGCNCEEQGIISEPPKIQASPKSLIFEAIPVGDKLNKSLTLKNSGGQDLTITEIKAVNESSSQAYLLLTKKDMPLILTPDEEVKLTIRYQPKRAGSARGHLRVVSDADNVDNPEGVFKVPFRSNQLNADISVDPNPLDFGITKPGDDVVKSFEIVNRGNANLTVNGLEFKSNKAGEFKIVTPFSKKELGPGKKIKIDIQYNPSKNVSDEILYVLNNTQENPKYEVRLIGQRAAPDIEVAPVKLVFDDVFLGTKGVKKFTITNKGTVDLRIEGLSLDASTSKDFNVLNPPAPNTVIKPKAKIEVSVEYYSRDVTDDKGIVKIKSNDPDTPEVKVLLEAKAKGCHLVADPKQLHFTIPGQKKVTVANKGNLPCTFKLARFSATTSKEFTFFVPPPSLRKLAPNSFVELTINFQPQDSNDDVGELQIESDDPDEPKLVVKLTSKLNASQACQIDIKPTSINFGFVGIGRSRQRSVELTNNGYSTCNISNLTINPNPGNAFILITQVPPQGLNIPSNAKVEIQIAYTPPNAGTNAGILLIKSNDQKTPEAKVNLNGSSGKLCLEALPDPMDFGSVKVNCSSQREKMEIFNICSTTATVNAIRFGAGTNKTKQEFFIKSAPVFPKAVKFGESFQIVLSYVARDLGVDVGILEIDNTVAGQSPISVTLRGEGVNTDTQKDVFRQLKKPQIDILFVIDDSCSMGNDQNNLANNSTSFINWAAKLQVDYQIGVITTDVGKKGCLRGSTKIITPQTPNLITVFKSNAVAGTRGSGHEKGLETSYMALSNPSVSGCNKGFYRPSASLSVIYVSDEPDYSTNPVAFYINFLKNLKGFRNPDKIRASAIGSRTAAQCSGATNCRYYEVSKALRGIYEHISSANWGQTLSQLGAVTFGYRTQFFLSRPADQATIKVKVNGVAVPQGSANGWVYESTSNSVNFSKSVVPAAGALIEITYRAICLPP